MSIKGIVTISREEAIDLIMKTVYDDADLSQSLVSLEIVDDNVDIELKNFGNIFDVKSDYKNETYFKEDVACYL
jgi:hypothetical protein